jgi:hypothetical protein
MNLFSMLNEISHNISNDSDDTNTSDNKPSDIEDRVKFKLLTATLCSCVSMYAQYNNQRSPDNPHETLRKTMTLCDKLISANLLSQSDAENVIEDIKETYPLNPPSPIQKIINTNIKIFEQHVPELFDEYSDKIKEQYVGKIDKVMMNAVNKLLIMCGGGKGFAKFLGVEAVNPESTYTNP